MRGNKRRAAAFVTAANKPQPALNDAILDVVNRKGVRCCVECGATSTPQWREGPMGPKTLCNACGVRRQRLLRKQQAATEGIVPTAPVAAVQARRRMTGRSALQAPTVESDDLPYAAVSGSEHSSDETETDWATTTPAKQHLHQQRQPRRHQLAHEVEERGNEDESAAHDLLFFAGVERGAVGCGGLSGVDGEWRSNQHHRHSGHYHGHNTRRNGQPLQRSDDFYYYAEEEEEEEEDAPGLEGGEADDGSCKRRRKIAPQPLSRPRPQVRAWLAGSSFSSTEDVAESGLPFQAAMKQGHRDHQPQETLAAQTGVQGQPPVGLNGKTASLPQPSAPDAAVSALSPLRITAAATTMTPSAAPGAVFAPLLGVPVALPVLPLSLSLPSLPPMSTRDYEMVLKLQLDFQRACLQLQQANVKCEAVSEVVAEQRQAAARAHEQGAAAAQQLASEARAVADVYRLRDVLSVLRSATGKAGVEAAEAGSEPPAVAVIHGGGGGGDAGVVTQEDK